jgi:dinuclear metal center YbgI/SA1388 family protein
MPTTLNDVTTAMQSIAPLELAEEWDNVGLLIEPSKPKPIRRVLLTIDLTESVLEEAIRLGVGFIVAYHPPLFDPIKHLAYSTTFAFKQRLAIRAIESGISVYSPHTALDSVQGGVNDWLLEGFGAGWSGPMIEYMPKIDEARPSKVVVFVPAKHADQLRNAMADAYAGWIGRYSHCSFNIEGVGTFRGGGDTSPAVGKKERLEKVAEIRLEMICISDDVPLIVNTIRAHHPYEEPAIDVYPLTPITPKELAVCGQGRFLHLDEPVKLTTLVSQIKAHLGLRAVRVAEAPSTYPDGKVHTVGACAGAGGALLKNFLPDVFITGEMRHHDVLAANARGISVILCDHTNTERGYLPTLKKKLREKLGKAVKIDISKADREPLRIV